MSSRGTLLERIVFSDCPYLELEKVREETGWDKKKFAEQLGVTVWTITSYESGKRPNFSWKTLRRFVDAIEIIKEVKREELKQEKDKLVEPKSIESQEVKK